MTVISIADDEWALRVVETAAPAGLPMAKYVALSGAGDRSQAAKPSTIRVKAVPDGVTESALRLRLLMHRNARIAWRLAGAQTPRGEGFR
jgi:uncharacterized protein (DUF3084 family)